MEGFLYQVGATGFEATRLVLVERLLSDPKYKMDPMVSLYYYAPICTILNGLAALVVEVPQMSMANIIANTLPAKRFARFARKPKPTPLTKPPLIFPATNQPTHPHIGKSSPHLLTLCGVLKDIVVVAAFILI